MSGSPGLKECAILNKIGPVLHGDRPRVVVFGGGKGGIGRSTLCADIARSMTRNQQRILCVDVAWSCPILNILLGADEPRFDPDRLALDEEGAHIADFITPTSHNGV